MTGVELSLDFVFIVLLSIMIAYSIKLNRNLKLFRQHQHDMQSMMGDFNSSFDKADENFEGFKNLTQDSQHDLQSRLVEAERLIDELKMMIESADSIANRLERVTESASKKPVLQPKDYEQGPTSEIDYYKSTSPASTAIRRQTASVGAGISSDLRASSNVSYASKPSQDSLKAINNIKKTLSQVKSQAERDILNALNINNKDRVKR